MTLVTVVTPPAGLYRSRLSLRDRRSHLSRVCFCQLKQQPFSSRWYLCPRRQAHMRSIPDLFLLAQTATVQFQMVSVLGKAHNALHPRLSSLSSNSNSSVQDGIYALGITHTRSTPSFGSFPNVASETVPMFV